MRTPHRPSPTNYRLEPSEHGIAGRRILICLAFIVVMIVVEAIRQHYEVGDGGAPDYQPSHSFVDIDR